MRVENEKCWFQGDGCPLTEDEAGHIVLLDEDGRPAYHLDEDGRPEYHPHGITVGIGIGSSRDEFMQFVRRLQR